MTRLSDTGWIGVDPAADFVKEHHHQNGGGSRVHRGVHMAVDVEGDRDGRVPQSFLNDLGLNARRSANVTPVGRSPCTDK